MLYFIKHVYLILLLSDQYLYTLSALPQNGEKAFFKTPDLNLPHPDESPLESLCSLPPTESFCVEGSDSVLLGKEATLQSSSSITQHSASSVKRKPSTLDTNLAANEARLVVKKRRVISKDKKEDWPRDNEKIVNQGSTSTYSGSHKLNIHRTPIENLKYKLSPQNTNSFVLESSQDAYQIINVHDWNFLKKVPHKESNSDLEDYQKTKTDCMFEFIEDLNTKEGYSKKDKIMSNTAGKKAAVILKMYNQCKERFAYPSEMTRNERQRIVLRNILWISREKIGLRKFKNSLEEISKGLEKGLKARMGNSSKRILRFKSKKSLIVEYVGKINIIATGLTVLYLALFQEHEEGKLTKEFIQGVVDFLKGLWTEIDKGENEDLQKRIFAQNLHRLLSLEDNHLDFSHKNMPQNIMSVSRNFAEYWIETRYPKLEILGKKDYREPMAEIINKIIFFSDYE
ncbi:hypothetical protein PGTUg99_009297 [Puccinia graminis f. sp. tritici]|uniref:Uncharacterized protein n=1 Tax=Puccinia graminis f. sp. tritici TaxID=56615 RepID=A0A5B0S0N6_PUCGR|nr:hypothetical protein PGTUg99_009297 [Puccinia graminis f. sp. tritici]